MDTFYSPQGRRNLYKTAYVPYMEHKLNEKCLLNRWTTVEIRRILDLHHEKTNINMLK